MRNIKRNEGIEEGVNVYEYELGDRGIYQRMSQGIWILMRD